MNSLPLCIVVAFLPLYCCSLALYSGRQYLEIIIRDETVYYSYHDKHTNTIQITRHFLVNGGKFTENSRDNGPKTIEGSGNVR